MATSDYNDIYLQLSHKLAELKEQRTELETALGDLSKQIESLEQTTSSLAPLAGLGGFNRENVSALGITDAVRGVLDANERLSVAQIKNRMSQRGFDFSRYSAPDQSIHKILKRLVDAGKAQLEKDDWKSFYKLAITDEEVPF